MPKRGENLPLLGGDTSVFNSKPKSNTKRNISYILNVVAIVTIAILLFHNSSKSDTPNVPAFDPHGKKNIIMMVTDGMGPASLSAARSFRQLKDNLPIDDVLIIDKYLIGSSRTRSSSSLITDSAAGATAFHADLNHIMVLSVLTQTRRHVVQFWKR